MMAGGTNRFGLIVIRPAVKSDMFTCANNDASMCERLNHVARAHHHRDAFRGFKHEISNKIGWQVD